MEVVSSSSFAASFSVSHAYRKVKQSISCTQQRRHKTFVSTHYLSAYEEKNTCYFTKAFQSNGEE